MPRAANHAPRRLFNGPSAAVRVCSSTARAAARSFLLSVVHETVEVRVDGPELLRHGVRRREHFVERGDVGVGRCTRFDLADIELVVERTQAIDVGEDALECGSERAIVERREDRLEIPARNLPGRGHDSSFDTKTTGRFATSQLPTAVFKLMPGPSRGVAAQRSVMARSTSWICMRASAAPMQ